MLGGGEMTLQFPLPLQSTVHLTARYHLINPIYIQHCRSRDLYVFKIENVIKTVISTAGRAIKMRRGRAAQNPTASKLWKQKRPKLTPPHNSYEGGMGLMGSPAVSSKEST